MLNADTLPTLDTTCTEPLFFLKKHFLSHCKKIDSWFQNEWKKTPPPVYGSVDLRNAGFKLAPIDMNLFPAGFNNLNPNFLPLSIDAAKKIIIRIAPQTKRIMVIPESHTRNLFYWENIKTLQTILEDASFQVRFGVLMNDIKAPLDIALPSGGKITVEPLKRTNNILSVSDFTPDFILLNNDLSEGIPPILKNLEQPIIPPATLGWNQRLKS